MPKHFVSTFYLFKKLNDLESIKSALEQKAEELNIRGLLILGSEGFNTTCSATSVESLNQFKNWIQEYFDCHGLFFKDSHAYTAPFRRYKVKIREEIVTTGIPGVMPPEGVNHHLSPEEWNRVLKEESDYVIIDTRNWYEYKIGTFKGAINPNIEKFTDFPEFMEKQGIPKDKKMLIFCTGGIRCEKGILELQNQGYNNVYQLEGGIINYLAKHPNEQFEGECFVFDHRVALDQNLEPSEKYGLCPHCGQPAETLVTCIRCDHDEKICENCREISIVGETCSKNCANQWKLHPGKKGPRQLLPFEIEKMKDQGLDPEQIPTIQVTKTKKVTLNDKGEAITITNR
ncbi:MAG: rhodanese-related sulfurtransferase [Bdellovibrionia bacterium]